MRKKYYLISLLASTLTLVSSCKAKEPMETSTTAPEEPTSKVVKTEEEWKKLLTPEQYRIARQSGTERAFGDVYEQFKKQGAGAYHCVACGSKLFTSKEKFDGKCGWPAFYDPAHLKSVTTKEDRSYGMVRIEVNCAKCDAHLGHLFKGEGYETPVDQRYCINGTVLKFVPEKAAEKKSEVKEEVKEEKE